MQLSRSSNSFDVEMGMFDDRNEYITVKLDQVRQDITLIPDTGINEVVMIHESCENCFRPEGVTRWNIDPDTALE